MWRFGSKKSKTMPVKGLSKNVTLTLIIIKFNVCNKNNIAHTPKVTQEILKQLNFYFF